MPLLPQLHAEWDAFNYLSVSRPVHFGGVGYITQEAILAYVLLRGLQPGSELVEDLIRGIRVLDYEFMQVKFEERETQEKEEAKKGKSKEITGKPRGASSR